jgi:hypothetical protein
MLYMHMLPSGIEIISLECPALLFLFYACLGRRIFVDRIAIRRIRLFSSAYCVFSSPIRDIFWKVLGIISCDFPSYSQYVAEDARSDEGWRH